MMTCNEPSYGCRELAFGFPQTSFLGVIPLCSRGFSWTVFCPGNPDFFFFFFFFWGGGGGGPVLVFCFL